MALIAEFHSLEATRDAPQFANDGVHLRVAPMMKIDCEGLPMDKKTKTITMFLLLVLVLSACNSRVPQPAETTDTTPLETATEKSAATATQIRKTATPLEPMPQPDDIGYYEGIITITRYYTFLGHGLYEEAYQLLGSSARKHSPSLEEYVENGKRWFKKVKIITIQPYPVFIKEQGGQLRSSDSTNIRRFYVQIIAWGEGRMSGSRVSGEVQTLFLRLVKEDGEWKIDEFGTAPLF